MEKLTRAGYGEGAPPDVIIVCADTTANARRCTASVRLLSPNAVVLRDTDVLFDPEDVKTSSASIAESAWGALVQDCNKLAAMLAGAAEEKRETRRELVAVRVESAKLRHKTTLLLRELLRKRVRA